MSSGFIIERPLIEESRFPMPIPEEVDTPLSGKPSTTMSGLVEPERELAPLMSILVAAPGWPLVDETMRPATPPLRASSMEKMT